MSIISTCFYQISRVYRGTSSVSVKFYENGNITITDDFNNNCSGIREIKGIKLSKIFIDIISMCINRQIMEESDNRISNIIQFIQEYVKRNNKINYKEVQELTLEIDNLILHKLKQDNLNNQLQLENEKYQQIIEQLKREILQKDKLY